MSNPEHRDEALSARKAKLREPAESMAREPLHRRVYAGLKADIASGRLGIGDLLPSEAEIASVYQTSRITVRHALDRLAQAGLVRKRHGARAQIIAGSPLQQAVWRLESLDDIIASVGDASLDIQSFRNERNPIVADLFEARQGAALACLRSRLIREGRCYARSTIYFRPDIGKKLTRGQFDDVIVFRVLQRDLGLTIRDVRVTVRVLTAEPEDIAAFGASVGEPVVETMFVYRTDDGAPVEIAFSRQRAANFSLSYALKPSSY